jgi:D-xylonolactonase
MSGFEVLANGNDRCGESPIWDASSRRLFWNDMNASRVFSFDHKTQAVNELQTNGLNSAGIALNHTGELVFTGSSGLHLWRQNGEHKTILNEHNGQPLNFNDALADPKGRLYAGTWYWGAENYERTGTLYLINTDGTIIVQDEGIELSNGLGLSPDEKTLYYADSSARKIYAYHVNQATGELSNRRIFVNVPRAEGIPDGLTVDSQGFIWSAQWYGSQIVRYDPDGKVERRINIPAAQVTCMAFGGPDMNELYITTASEDWPTSYAPPNYNSSGTHLGGELLRLKLDIQGKPEYQTKFNW